MNRLRPLAIGLALVTAGCWYRTPLLDNEDPCDVIGNTRACGDVCGPGTQTCVAGFWKACEIPPTSRACSNDCGPGTESCSGGTWRGICEVPRTTRACSSMCGPGTEFCADGKWQGCDAPLPKAARLRAVVRDFNDTHPDFETGMGSDLGIVENQLGADDKPVYAGRPKTPTTNGRAAFDQWYRDVPGINLSAPLELPLTPSASDVHILKYDSDSFFPIDDRLFGNQGRVHNFHFTVELATKFRYAGGETFRFTGDDDMWIFINRQLVIDLGGVHGSLEGHVDLDAAKGRLGIVPGGVYPLHLFFAERHTSRSTFHITTTIADLGSCE